ncbi:MAG TPA: choice-of-anchor D domain-containing protein, partial [Natronosporangium sp.]|nr:choice-of-anchor D domain-containing protein [Natronosporangium sp.]
MERGQQRVRAVAVSTALTLALVMGWSAGAGSAHPSGFGAAAPGPGATDSQVGTQAELGWRSQFFGPGLDTGDSATGSGGATALAVWDDGDGPALYAGGWFITAGPHEANRIARWDGEQWSPLVGPDGTGITMAGSGNANVHALAVYDGALIVGGYFDRAGGVPVHNVARWDGRSWQPMGAGLSGGIGVETLAVINGELYAGGSFRTSGDTVVERVARWDGESWQPVGGGMGSGYVYALAEYDGALIAGGSFTDADGQPIRRIARFDGDGWQPLGEELDNTVRALIVYDGQLIAGGVFDRAGGATVNRIARFDGQRWQPLGSGMSGGQGPTVYALTTYRGDLIAAGAFQEAGGATVNYIARWDGTEWSPLAGPDGVGTDNGVSALTVYQDTLIAGSSAFRRAGGVVVNYLAAWDGTGWSALPGLATGLSHAASGFGSVAAAVVWDGALIVAGEFVYAGGQVVNRVARWDGATWQPLRGSFGTGVSGSVSALAVYQGDLIVAGRFEGAGGLTVNGIARWDGREWWPLSGPAGAGLDSSVTTLAVYDGDLIVGGHFQHAGGVPAPYLARWDGTRWSAFDASPNQLVSALAVYDGDLIVAGSFTQLGDTPVNRIARWDGGQVHPLAEGVDRSVLALTVHEDALYVGGTFTQAGGAAAHRIARWDGVTWSALSTPEGAGVDRDVTALASFRGELYLGGRFTQAGGAAAQSIARWDGAAFQPLTGGGVGGVVTPVVAALTPYDPDGPGPLPEQLAVGGTFHTTGGMANWGLAMYGPTDPVAHLTASPASVDFGATPTGEAAEPVPVTLTSSGTLPVQVAELPAPAAPFTEVERDCPEPPFTLAPTTSCTVWYGFAPTDAGEQAATVRIGTDAGVVTVTLAGVGLAAPPVISVVPDQVAAELVGGDTGTVEVQVRNSGQSDLDWWFVDDTTSVAVSAGTAAAARTLTHSASMEVLPDHAVSCTRSTGDTRPSQFLRTFRLTEFGIEEDFLVTGVTFGVQAAASEVPLTVNLYTLDGELRYDNLRQLATTEVTVSWQAGGLVEVPVRAWVPAGAELVVEVAAPELADRGFFFPGANHHGQTAPSYFASSACGHLEPVDLAALGFPQVHLVMAVTGQDRQGCARPDWLSVSPSAGVTAPGASSEVTVTFDASGLAPGEYEALLCVESNDPVSPVVEVPVALTV